MAYNSTMPIRYHEHDAKWIREMLGQLTPALKIKACVGYNQVYDQHFNDEPLTQKKSNKARQAANTRLRKFVDAAKEAHSKKSGKAIADRVLSGGSAYNKHSAGGKAFSW